MVFERDRGKSKTFGEFSKNKNKFIKQKKIYIVCGYTELIEQ